MITRMRTTLVLDDRLLTEAKRRAADRNTTVSEVVNDALRGTFEHREKPRRPFRLITYGDPNKPEHISPSEMKGVLEDEDLGRFR